jgi:two-component system, NtrC family, sensor kinase
VTHRKVGIHLERWLPPGATHWRHATRRRLFLAISALALAFTLAMLFAVRELARIGSALEVMEAHEEQMHLALQLEASVRSQYAHQAHFVVGEHAHLAGHRDAHARALEATRALAQAAHEPEIVQWLREIEKASDALDRVFMEGIAPAVLNRDSSAMLLHDKSYAHVSVIEANADRIFGLLQRASVEVRKEVLVLERATFRWTMVLLVVALLFAGAVALYLGRSVARPLARLGRGAARVAGGDLGARIDIDSPDEFGLLAAEFNAMTEALNENQRKLIETEKLAGIGRLAAGFAHEINNPLGVVLGYLGLHHSQLTGRLARDFEVMKQEVLRCKAIVQELLEIARPPRAPGTTAVDLRGVCDEVVETLRSSGTLQVAATTVEGAGVVLGQGAKLRQVVVNLLRNAAEAAGPAGHVGVQVAVAGPWVEVTFRDDGPGIPPEARSQLFEPFFTLRPDGTGLGLAVSRSIAKAHGGDIEVVPSDKGAVFKVRVPSTGPGGEAA